MWYSRHSPVSFLFLGSLLILLLSACGGGNTNQPTVTGSPTLANRQVLTLPNVGTQDIGVMDPAQGADANSALAVNMIYSGLVASDKNLNVIPDQATWDVSSDGKVYIFHLKQGITFSDGTPVTAQTYVYTFTRALLPKTNSGIASLFMGAVQGANDVNSGKATTLNGVKALNDTTLQITLTKPTAYFLSAMANSIYFPLNKKLIDQYSGSGSMPSDWAQHVAGSGAGTGPFMVKEWDHNVKMVLVPNPHYYGKKTRLTEVDMLFVSVATTAYKSYRAGQYDFVWNIAPSDLQSAKSLAGFATVPLLQTDLLFFSNKMPPFDSAAVRQAFAAAIDKRTLVHVIFQDSVVAAPTIIPPGMPGYQPNYPGIPYDRAKARQLLTSVYPDVTKVPSITFSYPNSQVTSSEAAALQNMWQTALGIVVKLRPVELNAYNAETQTHSVQFGFTQWGADFADPYDWLALNLLPTAPNNNGDWNNATFVNLINQAEQSSGDARIVLYNQAEQVAIQDVGWLPIDHESVSIVIPPNVHGVSVNGFGLYFGDWSDVYLLQR
jgi:oligopeptide transport system substrate-binding protein